MSDAVYDPVPTVTAAKRPVPGSGVRLLGAVLMIAVPYLVFETTMYFADPGIPEWMPRCGAIIFACHAHRIIALRFGCRLD